METELIIESIMGLVAILAFLVFLLFFIPNEEKKKKEEERVESSSEPLKQELMPTDLKSLMAIIKDKKSSTQTLGQALDIVIKYHGTVHTKLGIRAHPDFDAYFDILFTLCRHRNADKDIILKFEKALVSLNPDYKEDINEAMTKGLNSRRV
ncbi:hypothetical protein HUE87_00245 [Candidatus Sulfurimonas marisnigri]|uniref:Uncharacterized protein n=1 Tax=Candidatus Sulfurimonas marisnigri TaxID=2740405 RepID=A0A7S7M092_9BACT|nr:hypothetical protein [Candidatus Sulfurimonas marisnigri]QOY54715.1 hypothetical protein HUE87_00245 [Candidatus Sulfurimonas marisnigri]